MIEDTGTANGVFFNDGRISSSREIRDDDVIRIGDCVLTVTGARFEDGVYLRLKGLSTGFSSTVFEFDTSPSMIGRATEADVSVIHPSIARRHTRVVRRHDGSVVVSDPGSANGLVLNGVGVKVSRLEQGDHLKLGDVSWVMWSFW